MQCHPSLLLSPPLSSPLLSSPEIYSKPYYFFESLCFHWYYEKIIIASLNYHHTVMTITQLPLATDILCIVLLLLPCTIQVSFLLI